MQNQLGGPDVYPDDIPLRAHQYASLWDPAVRDGAENIVYEQVSTEESESLTAGNLGAPDSKP